MTECKEDGDQAGLHRSQPGRDRGEEGDLGSRDYGNRLDRSERDAKKGNRQPGLKRDQGPAQQRKQYPEHQSLWPVPTGLDEPNFTLDSDLPKLAVTWPSG
jgi:hypothetical protein